VKLHSWRLRAKVWHACRDAEVAAKVAGRISCVSGECRAHRLRRTTMRAAALVRVSAARG
jgi:hypothetical protein